MVGQDLSEFTISGSRWFGHKWNAFYLSMVHIPAALSDYPSVLIKLSLRVIIGSGLMVSICLDVWTFFLLVPYFQKWSNADDLDILALITSLIRSVKKVDKLQLDRWPTCAAILKCTSNDGAISYQLQEIVQFKAAKTYFSSMYKDYCSKVSGCIKARLAWSDIQLWFCTCHSRVAESTRWRWSLRSCR